TGTNFSASPLVCISAQCVAPGGSTTYGGVTISPLLCAPNCDVSITILVTVLSTVGPGALFAITVLPQLGAFAQSSGSVALQIQPPPTLKLQTLDVDPGKFISSYKATDGTYTSEANTQAVLNNIIYSDPSLSGSPSLAPANFRLFTNQTTRLSRLVS